MHGLSPINNSLTSKQRELSAEIASAVEDLPTTLTDLISQMAEPDFTEATQSLELAEDGFVIQNPRNNHIVAMIELALTTPSSECAPAIKNAIFHTAALHYKEGAKFAPYLQCIINRLNTNGRRLNLDDVVIRNVDMRKIGSLEIRAVSAKRAVFDKVDMWKMQLINADFTGARFIDSSLGHVILRGANVTDAEFQNVEFRATEISGLRVNQSHFRARAETRPDVLTVNNRQYQIDRLYMNGQHATIIPDMAIFTLPAEKNIRQFAPRR